jgi:mono/diheme cytochrome c family protein
MIPCKPTGHKLTLILLSFFVLFSINKVSAQGDAAAGKQIFTANCASCHKMGADMTGPDLNGVESRWPDRGHLRQWIKNWEVAVTNGWPEAVTAQNIKGTKMNAFEFLTDKQLDDVIEYITTWEPPAASTPGEGGTSTSGGGGSQNAVIFGVISLILFVIALIMMQVNSNLKKMSDDASGIQRPEPVPFYRNKVYIALAAIIFFVLGGYFLAMGAIGLGRQKDYQPEQPIYYSHKVHAGVNQISCLYCHGNAWESKTAAIPSVNVCMNCHKAIREYKGAPLYDEDGMAINGTAQIQRLYEYAGFDPNNADAWDASKAKPIPWKKIHNLPDHVYFNHSQHVKAGKVQCQTCHGEITAMDEVKQVSELSMGWCVNCHRQTKVDFNYDSTSGNKYYSIYEKFHNDFRPDTARNKDGSFKLDENDKLIITPSRRDSIRVVDIGGLECQKCHY